MQNDLYQVEIVNLIEGFTNRVVINVRFAREHITLNYHLYGNQTITQQKLNIYNIKKINKYQKKKNPQNGNNRRQSLGGGI